MRTRKLIAAGLAVAALGVGASVRPVGASTGGSFGDVHGKVIDASTGKPVKHACVILWTDPTPITVAASLGGTYDIINAPTGSWKSTAYDCGASPKYYSGVYNGSGPTIPGLDTSNGVGVNVISGAPNGTTGIDFALGKAALIKMTVTDSFTKKPIQNVSICPEDASTNAPLGFCAPTDATGKSTIVSVPGPTKLYILDNSASRTNPSPPGYPTNTWLPEADFANATTYNTVAGANPVKFKYQGDINQPGHGAVTGIIRDKATGQPLAGECATAWGNGIIASDAPTGPDGRYTISNVPNGLWEITAEPCDSAHDGHYPVVYKNQPGLDTTKMTQVPVLNGQTTPNIDFSLGTSGRIHVLVVDTNNNPISGAGATPFKATLDSQGFLYQTGFGTGDFTTGTAGDVLIGDMVPGKTKFIAFAPCYASAYYGDIVFTLPNAFANSKSVMIVAGQTAPSITIKLQPDPSTCPASRPTKTSVRGASRGVTRLANGRFAR